MRLPDELIARWPTDGSTPDEVVAELTRLKSANQSSVGIDLILSDGAEARVELPFDQDEFVVHYRDE